METSAFRIFIDNLKELNKIEEVTREEGVSLSESLKAPCPFHDETKPSFSVKKDEQYAHCFGCHWTGDVIAFIQHKKNLEFMETVRYLAHRAKLTMPDLSPEEMAKIEEERDIQNVLTEATPYYQSQLTEAAKGYIKGRGISDESIERLKIGWAKGGLVDHLVKVCGFPVDLCIKAGVVKIKEDGTVKDFYHNRIIFPVLKNGRTVFLTGRRIDENENSPKYLNLPLPIKSFYNEEAIKDKEVFVTEGIIDCISLEQWGYSTIAIIGNRVQDEARLAKLARCEKVYLCLDADSGGYTGMEEIGKVLPDKAKIIKLPEGQDPNDYYLKHTKEDFQKLVDGAQGVVTYLVNKIPPDTDRTELPKKLETVLEILSRMHKAKVEFYLSDIRSYFGLNARELDGYREHIKELQNKRYKEDKDKQAKIAQNGKDAPIPIAIFPNLVDLAEHKGATVFLVKDKDDLIIRNEYQIDDRVHVPPSKEKIPWLLPNAEKVLKIYREEKKLPEKEVCSKLFDDLVAYHKSISALPSDAHYVFIAAWDMHTYLLEKMQYSPMICLFAVPERGKSRTGRGIINVSYRGICVESLREAYLLRVSQHLGASLFFDVTDIWKKSEKHGSEDIILLRFEKGAKVPRVLYPDAGPFADTVYFAIFGPTVIATNERADSILETRAVTIVMPESNARFEKDVTPELAIDLKCRLLAFRARHIGEALPDIPKPANSRLGDILKPIMQILHMVKPTSVEQFEQLIAELNEDRQNEKGSSLEAELLSAVHDLANKVTHGKLPVKDIADLVNSLRPPRYEFTYQFIGRRLGAMGFKKASIGNGCSALLWDEKFIQSLMSKYGVGKPPEHHKPHKRLIIAKHHKHH